MSNLYSIFIDSDLYEISFRNNTITRVIKYCGDSQLRREVLFSELSKHTQDLIITEITNPHAKDT